MMLLGPARAHARLFSNCLYKSQVSARFRAGGKSNSLLKHYVYTGTKQQCGSTVHLFSSSAGPSPPSTEQTEEEADNAASNTLLGRIFTPQTQTYLMIGGGALGSFAVARVVMSFTSFFTHLTPLTMAKYGFYMGFGTASAMAGLALFSYDTITIRADPVYRYGLSKIQSSDACIQAIGDGIVEGSLRSYRLDPGQFEACSATRLVYRPPRIQMLFDVNGQGPPYRTGIVTIEAHKATGSFPPKLTTTVLKLDYELDAGEHQTIWLLGDEEKYQRVSKRSGIRLSELGKFMHINKAVRK